MTSCDLRKRIKTRIFRGCYYDSVDFNNKKLDESDGQAPSKVKQEEGQSKAIDQDEEEGGQDPAMKGELPRDEEEDDDNGEGDDDEDDDDEIGYPRRPLVHTSEEIPAEAFGASRDAVDTTSIENDHSLEDDESRHEVQKPRTRADVTHLLMTMTTYPTQPTPRRKTGCELRAVRKGGEEHEELRRRAGGRKTLLLMKVRTADNRYANSIRNRALFSTVQ